MRALLYHIRTMFTVAEKSGMTIGMVRINFQHLSDTPSSSEGPLVSPLKVLCDEEWLKIGEHQLRNDWRSSLERGIELCEKHGHQGDATTLREVLKYLES